MIIFTITLPQEVSDYSYQLEFFLQPVVASINSIEINLYDTCKTVLVTDFRIDSKKYWILNQQDITNQNNVVSWYYIKNDRKIKVKLPKIILSGKCKLKIITDKMIRENDITVRTIHVNNTSNLEQNRITPFEINLLIKR